MFAIDHAATALLLKRRYPRESIAMLLISVQLMELIWVVLNFAGIERTTTENTVRTVRDIHLTRMPYSHSVVTTLAVAVLVWLVVAKLFRKPTLAIAVAIGVTSHLILDLLTHARDIVLAPGLEGMRFGLGLYEAFPPAAFVLEVAYGVLCWWIYRGGKALLVTILLFNLGNVSFFFASVPGPEELLAGHPVLIVSIILIQIAVTLALVGYFSRRATPPPTGQDS